MGGIAGGTLAGNEDVGKLEGRAGGVAKGRAPVCTKGAALTALGGGREWPHCQHCACPTKLLARQRAHAIRDPLRSVLMPCLPQYVYPQITQINTD